MSLRSRDGVLRGALVSSSGGTAVVVVVVSMVRRLDGWHPHISPLHKALSLIPALPQVSRFVVGICHAHELAAIASAYAHLHPCHDDELSALACDEPAFINPALWRTS